MEIATGADCSKACSQPSPEARLIAISAVCSMVDDAVEIVRAVAEEKGLRVSATIAPHVLEDAGHSVAVVANGVGAVERV